MTTKRLDAFTEGRNPLEPEEAGAIAEGLALQAQTTGEAARLLLLCHALTYEREMHKREYMLTEIKARVSPYLSGFSELGADEMRRELARVKGSAS